MIPTSSRDSATMRYLFASIGWPVLGFAVVAAHLSIEPVPLSTVVVLVLVLLMAVLGLRAQQYEWQDERRKLWHIRTRLRMFLRQETFANAVREELRCSGAIASAAGRTRLLVLVLLLFSWYRTGVPSG